MRALILRDESGIALIMAVGVMMVLSATVVGVIEFSAANSRSTHYANAGDKAFALAEAGHSDGLARLANVTLTANPYLPGAVGTGSRSLNGGTASYTGALSGLTWTVIGTGTAPNPIAGGAPLTRQVSSQVQITTQGTAWEWNYADATSGCLTIANNSTFAAPLFTRGNFCLSNTNSAFTGARLHVGGTLTTNNGWVGYPTSWIASANIVGGCLPAPHPCTPGGDHVFATVRTSTPSALAKPSIDLTGWYGRAAPGPMVPCTIGSVPGNFDTGDGLLNRSRSTFELTPAAMYDCRVVDGLGATLGRLSWTPGSPGTLTIAGTIFFDGSIHVAQDAIYSGRATIYSSGTVTLGLNTELCGVAACDDTWDADTNLLLFAAGSTTDTYGFVLRNNAVFQGAAYVVNDYLLSNNATNWGPVVARQFTIENNAGLTKPLAFVPPGTPGIEETFQPVVGSWSG